MKPPLFFFFFFFNNSMALYVALNCPEMFWYLLIILCCLNDMRCQFFSSAIIVNATSKFFSDISL